LAITLFGLSSSEFRVCERNPHSDEPEYYPVSVGLICLYARPFTNNKPVGPLSEDIIPTKHIELHRKILHMRNQLFAHTDASAELRPDDYPNELVFENDGKELRFAITRFLGEPETFEAMKPLVDILVKKTWYHREKLSKKFKSHFGPYKNLGEFRLNVLDPVAPIFSKLSTAEKLIRQEVIRPRTDPRGLRQG
jgi:hypothetical protein